ncbi:MAG: type VI secretion system tip protein VgrG [Bryobacteraceae bacterium]|nr:type VI secretion system tip protein VgrG [Bryobacteraceae bacterium]
MSGPITQHDRLYRLDTPLGTDKLIVRTFSGFEGVSQLYRYELELVSEHANLPVHRLIGQFVKFAVRMSDGKSFRHLGGFVCESAVLPPESRLYAYRVVLVPWIWFLTRTSDCRIEQEKTVPDIIRNMFDRYGYNDYRFELHNNYEPWEYSAQYRESSFNYFSRLCELEGLFYFFEQTENRTVLVIGDSPAVHPVCPGQGRIEMERSFGRGYRRVADTIHTWVVERQFQSGKYTHRDFNFERPKDNLEVQIPSASRLGNNEKFEVYDYPGEYEDTSDGDLWGRRRMEKTEAEDEIISGTSNARALKTGYKFDLVRHDRRDQNNTFVVTTMVHEGQEMNILPAQEITESFYRNQFTCIPHSKPFRSPLKTPKHLVKGVQTATVVGPSGEEIYSDKYGRVKVQFHWDREGKKNESSSCWIRVSHPWASSGYGALFLPRIGDEVIVDFLEGDPDRPIITGRVYNADNMPPYDLPGRQNWSGIKSRSTKGGGADNANELRFEDTKGSELFLMHAEKDMEITVENDVEEEIGNDRSSRIKNDNIEHVDGNEDRKIGGDQTVQIGGGQSTQAGGDITIKSGGTVTIEAMEIILKASVSVVLEGGTAVSMTASGSLVDAGPAGVTVKGAMVLINSGGAKTGSASAKSPKTAKAAKEPKRYKDK